jgi:hypothetical protein
MYYNQMRRGVRMESPVTLRLDSKTRRQIASAARRKGISKSEVIRRALNSWTDLADDSDAPFVMLKDLLGVVKGGNPRRSQKSGKKFRELLAAKRKRP